MKNFKMQTSPIVAMLILGGFVGISPVYGGSNPRVSDIKGDVAPIVVPTSLMDTQEILEAATRRHIQPRGEDALVVNTQNFLGAAAPFGVFGGAAGMTNEGIYTVINGNIGTTAASTLITGFHDRGAVYTETPLNIGAVNGIVYTATAPLGSVPSVIASAAALAAQTAFDDLSPASLPGGIDVSSLGGDAGELGNRTLAPGIYKSAPGSFAIQGGDLTLDGHGNPNAVWVFQMASTLLVGGPGAAFPQSVILVNGAQAKNVFWQVGSAATINAAGGGTMVGTIISSATTTFSTAGNVKVVTLVGRALALHASVTMVNTHINLPAL